MFTVRRRRPWSSILPYMFLILPILKRSLRSKFIISPSGDTGYLCSKAGDRLVRQVQRHMSFSFLFYSEMSMWLACHRFNSWFQFPGPSNLGLNEAKETLSSYTSSFFSLHKLCIIFVEELKRNYRGSFFLNTVEPIY